MSLENPQQSPNTPEKSIGIEPSKMLGSEARSPQKEGKIEKDIKRAKSEIKFWEDKLKAIESSQRKLGGESSFTYEATEKLRIDAQEKIDFYKQELRNLRLDQ